MKLSKTSHCKSQTHAHQAQKFDDSFEHSRTFVADNTFQLHIQMTVTWTSGYGINEAEPFVEWGPKGGDRTYSPAGTLTFGRGSMCGAQFLSPLNFHPKKMCLGVH